MDSVSDGVASHRVLAGSGPSAPSPVDMESGQLPPKPQQQLSRRKNRVEQLPGLFVDAPYRRFLSIKTIEGASISDLDVFDVHRTIVNVCGRRPKMEAQRDGTLLVEVNSPEESDRLCALSSVPGAQVSCTLHATLNHSRGTVYSQELMKYDEVKLLEELRESKVVDVRRFMRKVDGVLVPTPTLLLTFDGLQLPDSLDVAWFTLRVRQYVPSPRRCFYCQAYGHVGRTCRRKLSELPPICGKCGTAGHEGSPCTSPVSCFHCQGAHPAGSADCVKFKFEKEVLTIRTRERVSFHEAKRRAQSNFVRPGVSFASALSGLPKRRPLMSVRPGGAVASGTLSQSPPPSRPLDASAPGVAAAAPEMEVGRFNLKRGRSAESLGEIPPSKFLPSEVQSDSPEGPPIVPEVASPPCGEVSGVANSASCSDASASMSSDAHGASAPSHSGRGPQVQASVPPVKGSGKIIVPARKLYVPKARPAPVAAGSLHKGASVSKGSCKLPSSSLSKKQSAATVKQKGFKSLPSEVAT